MAENLPKNDPTLLRQQSVGMYPSYCGKNNTGLDHNLAVLRAKIKMRNPRNRPTTYDVLKKMAVRTLPRDSPGEGGPKTKS